MDYVLQTHGLTKTYGKVNAVENVDMNVPKGSIYGFVGKNGSGKTTLMRIVAGLIFQNSGQFSLYGEKTREGIPGARKKIAAVIETPAIIPNMNARDNLKMQCLLKGIDNEACIDEILELVHLRDAGKKKVKSFSLGMKQRLGIALTLVGEPDFLLLDEPTNGLDPEGIVEMREMLIRLNREKGVTILISSHILGELSKLATHYGFIDRGALLKEISADKLNLDKGESLENYYINLIGGRS